MARSATGEVVQRTLGFRNPNPTLLSVDIDWNGLP